MNGKNIILVSIVLVELTIIIIEIVALLECKQCLLFGTIFEVKRIIEGGPTIWCYMILINGLCSLFICTLLLLQRPVFGIQFRYFLLYHSFLPFPFLAPSLLFFLASSLPPFPHMPSYSL